MTKDDSDESGTERLTARLASAGFVAADDEARELRDAAAGDVAALERLVRRRLSGEPLAWITGAADFCGERVVVTPGVYVPRWQSEGLARRAVDRLPANGTAIDLCTGSGALALTLMRARPRARVWATDLDERAVACARRNGVDALRGDLFAPLTDAVAGAVDVIVAVVPYVPTSQLRLLPRDTLDFESTLSYDGGDEGTTVLRRVVAESPRFLHPGASLLLEVGGEQCELLEEDLASAGFSSPDVILDADSDVRGFEATFQP